MATVVTMCEHPLGSTQVIKLGARLHSFDSSSFHKEAGVSSFQLTYRATLSR
jgi:hypothetical protein